MTEEIKYVKIYLDVPPELFASPQILFGESGWEVHDEFEELRDAVEDAEVRIFNGTECAITCFHTPQPCKQIYDLWCRDK